MNSKPFYYGFLGFLISLSILLFVLMCTSSCNVTKGKKTLSVDSTRINKVDSGSVKKTTANETTNGEWQRQIIIFKDSTKPSTINLQPSFDYNRLAAVINEKGNYQKQKQSVNYDSSWKRELDSLKMVMKETTKDKTETVSPILVKIAAAVILFLVGAAAIKYVVKK